MRNQLLNSREILDGATVLESAPTHLGVSLTSRCNLRCIMCGSKDIGWNLPGEAVAEIERLLPLLNYVQWLGGEVFLSDHFDRLFETACRNKHLKQSINTNGLLIDEHWAPRLVDNNVSIDLSIDGLRRRTYEKIRIGGKFKTLVKNLKMIKKLRGKAASTTTVSMNFVVMEENLSDVPDIIDFASDNGIDKVMVSLLKTSTGEQGLPPAVLERLAQLFPVLDRKSRAAGIEFNNDLPVTRLPDAPRGQPGPEREPGVLPCLLPWKRLFIKPGGKVYPHCLCERPLGDIRTSTLLELWNSLPMQNYRTMLNNNDLKALDCPCANTCPPRHKLFNEVFQDDRRKNDGIREITHQ
jgi:MoaA/NifB/PqqE/SkfB family radical SAM enzyme